jgi:hypothetical protein
VLGARRARDLLGLVRRHPSALAPVDLLQPEDVGVERPGGVRQALGDHAPVGEGAAVEQVERRQAHPRTLAEPGRPARRRTVLHTS